ncbi:MAG: 50S ribosomal protein L29 [Propionibacteriales bacterium]|nr:50S ribosomal protein L29 [Propionibacteriales bacterium]
MMATTKAAELRNMGESELATKLGEAKAELFNLRFQAATGQLESHGRLRTVRRDIARIYTVLRERELGITEWVEAEAADEPSDESSEESAEEKSSDESSDEDAS